MRFTASLPSSLTKVCGSSGGKCIWLLNVLDDHRSTIGIEYYDLQNYHVVQASTCYQFSVFCLISPQYKMPFFRMLFQTFGESIHIIGDSNLRLESYPNTLLDCLLQVNQSERVVQFDLCIIECVSLEACRRIYNFLKSNLKPYYECVNSLETSYMLMMHLFLDANTIQHDHPWVNEAKVTFRLKYLKSKISPQVYRTDIDVKKAFSYFDPSRIFVSNGLYIYNFETLQLTLFSNDTAELYNLLPMITFDIETTAGNMFDLPTGCTEHEQIISYVLIATHLERAIICVNYLRFLSLQQRELIEEKFGDNGNTKWWKEQDRLLSEKYKRQFQEKYRDLYVWVESYDNEVQLLESFIQLYSRGQLLRALINNSKAKHFFTGHNITKYDMPFMLRRFKWHQMHQFVEDYVTYDTLSLGNDFDTESIIIKFHRNAYFIDSYRIFQNQHLACNLSLKSLTTTYLSMDTAKRDLNPVSVRIYYILGTMLQEEREECIIEFLRQVANDAMTSSLVTLSLTHLPRDVHLCLTNGNLDIDKLQVYGFDEFLAYNIIDCESVLLLWKKFNYTLLFSLITQIYPCNLEKALQANIATRTKIAFDYIAIKYRQILSAKDFTTIGTSKKLRYLFHCRLNESLFYKTTQIYGRRKNNDVDINDDCIEIDENRHRKNLDQFFAQVYAQRPITDLVKYKSTKKKYAGAAVIVHPGLYTNCVQLDIISQYPNILSGKKLFTDSVDSCSAGSLQQILTTDLTFRENFSSWISTDCIQIYLAEEESNCNFTLYLSDFSFNLKNPVVGQLIVNVETLLRLPIETPLLIYCPDSRSFLNNFVFDLLKVRKNLKEKISFLQNENNENLSVLESKQKFIKITANSIYGLFGNMCIPVAAMITLLGRKILIFASKLLPVIILKILIEHVKIWNWFHQNQLDLAHINFDIRETLGDRFNTHLVESLTSVKGREQFRTTCHLLLSHFSISSLATICEISSTNEIRLTHAILNENNISLLHLRCLLDGQTSVRQLNETVSRLQQMLVELGQSEENYIQNIFNALPLVVKNCVFDCDTDGLQFVNRFDLDSKVILQLLNDEIAKVFEMDNIVFTDKKSSHVFSLAKKKYTTFKFNPLREIKNKEIKIDDCGVQHIGYERNALPCFKYLCNFIAVLCLLIHQGKTLRFYKFREIIWSVFNYLETLSPGELYIKVKLNRLKVDSTRRRFIEKYTQTYNGSLRAVYILNRSSNKSDTGRLRSLSSQCEQLVLLDDYVCNVKQSNGNKTMQLQYGSFLRTFGKIWFQQYCLSIASVNDDKKKQFKKQSTMSIIDHYFEDWLLQPQQSRCVSDLDNFLMNRFIVVTLN